MVKLSVIAVGEKMPPWVNQGFEDYAKRLRGNTSLNLIEVPALKRGKNADIPRILQREGETVLSQLPDHCQLVTLERTGKHLDSLALAKQLATWQTEGQSVAFALGGPEGLDPAVMQRANHVWSLSAMTFSHHVARVMLAEQLYRAWSINQGMPYHR
ncbi:MAG: 23S rRNA (pseudouridine1915-N3)-methyltransferase [Cryomorphaceae bacterium]|jgi:23S rRNA (pseudouridine1915-N3)-methyltransferase